MKDAIGEAARKPYRFGWREGLLDFVCRSSCEQSACLSVLEGLPDLLRHNLGDWSACLDCFSAVPSETFIGTGDWSSCLFVVPSEISIGISEVALCVRLDSSSGQISFISQVGATVLK